MTQKPTFFYGWVIVQITVISMTIIYGVRHSFSIFFVDILKEFEWGRGSTAFMFSLNILTYGLLAPVAGSLADRWNPRKLMILGCVLIALATGACSLAKELWHFYVLFGILLPVGMVLAGWPIFAPAITNWFVERRGMALGIAVMGTGSQLYYRHVYRFPDIAARMALGLYYLGSDGGWDRVTYNRIFFPPPPPT